MADNIANWEKAVDQAEKDGIKPDENIPNDPKARDKIDKKTAERVRGIISKAKEKSESGAMSFLATEIQKDLKPPYCGGDEKAKGGDTSLDELLTLLLIMCKTPCEWASCFLIILSVMEKDASIKSASAALGVGEGEKSSTDWMIEQGKIHDVLTEVEKADAECKKQTGVIPKDVNHLKAGEIKELAGVDIGIARLVAREARRIPFHTANEMLRVPGINHRVILNLATRGVYFGYSGLRPKRR